MVFEVIPEVFASCLRLRELNFPQKRKFQAMYYVRPDMLICIDDLSALKNDGHTDFQNIFNALVFKPRLDDLIEESPWLHECIKMEDGTIMAYSKAEEDKEIIKKAGRTDPFIRARGKDHWAALVNLWIAVATKNPTRNISPEELEKSENQFKHGTADNSHNNNP